jgi:hypothetical protein
VWAAGTKNLTAARDQFVPLMTDWLIPCGRQVRTSENGLEHVTVRTVVFPTCEAHNDSAVYRKPGSLIEWCGFHNKFAGYHSGKFGLQ